VKFVFYEVPEVVENIKAPGKETKNCKGGYGLEQKGNIQKTPRKYEGSEDKEIFCPLDWPERFDNIDYSHTSPRTEELLLIWFKHFMRQNILPLFYKKSKLRANGVVI
jgi:hypothetical protein